MKQDIVYGSGKPSKKSIYVQKELEKFKYKKVPQEQVKQLVTELLQNKQLEKVAKFINSRDIDTLEALIKQTNAYIKSLISNEIKSSSQFCLSDFV